LTSLLSAYDAALIAEDLYENMLPRCEVTFREELRLWHPEINPRRYLDTRSYPRCWILTASLIFATSFPEYARLLLESMYQDQDGLRDRDLRMANRSDWFPVSLLTHRARWRDVICGLGTGLYIGPNLGPEPLTHAFAVGLLFAFAQPDATRTFVDIVRESTPIEYNRQVEVATIVVRRHPRSAVVL